MSEEDGLVADFGVLSIGSDEFDEEEELEDMLYNKVMDNIPEEKRTNRHPYSRLFENDLICVICRNRVNGSTLGDLTRHMKRYKCRGGVNRVKRVS